MRHGAGVVLLALLLLIVFPAQLAPARGGTSTGATLPASLGVSTTMQVLPADGATYPAVVVSLLDQSGQPTVAVNDTTVYLISAQEAVGQVEQTVKIEAGRSFVLANFTTTSNPGSTQVTASATGLESGVATVATASPTGYPDHLKVTPVPDTIAAQPSSHGSIIVELLDDSGLPAKAVRSTTVKVYSSNPDVANVTGTVAFSAGQFIRIMNYTPGYVPGTTGVTVSASGFTSGSTSISVLGPASLTLKAYAQPSAMMTCPATTNPQFCVGRLVIALLDQSGNPARAPRPITVFVSSSDLGVVSVPSGDTVQIPEGNISVITTFTTTPKNGTATITVSSPNLASDFATITTSPPTGNATGLKLYVGPATVLADHESYGSVVVSLVDKNGAPTVDPAGDVQVTLTSSIAGTGNITLMFLDIPAGQNYGEATITSTYQVGQTVITASAQNLFSDQAELSTSGGVPSKMLLKALSTTLPADGLKHVALEVVLEDAFGNPAVAPVGIPINLSSSQDGAVTVSSTEIPAGQSFAIVTAVTGLLPGEANITAVSELNSGPSISSAIIGTVVPSPSALVGTINTADPFLPRPDGGLFLTVQLTDVAGNPARARQNTTVTVTSSNGTVLGRTLSAQIVSGADHVMIPLPVTADGTTTLTVFSQGLSTASAKLTVVPYPLKVGISVSRPEILANQTDSLALSVTVDGVPMKGLAVRWNATNGMVGAGNATTDRLGAATAKFEPSSAGVSKVVASVSSPSFGSANVTAVIGILPVPRAPTPTLLEEFTSFPLVLVPVGGATGGALTTVLLIRRRSPRAEEESDELGSDEL